MQSNETAETGSCVPFPILHTSRGIECRQLKLASVNGVWLGRGVNSGRQEYGSTIAVGLYSMVGTACALFL